jgi:hypothetical protein
VTKDQETLSLGEVARRLDKAGICWAVFAGAAAGAYGATRPVTDVDLLVPAAKGEQVAALFPEAQVEALEEGCLGILLPGVDILAGLGWIDLDAEMAARLTRHQLHGVPVSVIPPEDNTLLKARMGRGPEVGKHDWQDVEAMMAFVSEFDWDYLRWRARAILPAERRQEILRRLEQMWDRLCATRQA